MSGSNDRPPIPEAIKRLVRQRCFFGCVVCGSPVFDYDHITEYALVGEHTTDNLTLLCPNHHRAKTVGRLGPDFIRERNATPFNASRSLTGPYNLESSRSLKLEFGTCHQITSSLVDDATELGVLVNGRAYLSCHKENGWLTFSAVVTDDDGVELLVVKRGELVASTQSWDITYVGSNLTVRSGLGGIVLEVVLTNQELNVKRGAFVDKRDRSGFLATPTGLKTVIGGRTMGVLAHCQVSSAGHAGWSLVNDATPPWNALLWKPC